MQDLSFLHPDGPRARAEVLRLSALRSRPLPRPITEYSRPDFHMLLLLLEGPGGHEVDFTHLDLDPGAVVHIRPGQVQAFSPGFDNEALVVLFRPEVLPPDTTLLGLDRLRPRAVYPAPEDFTRLVDITSTIERQAVGASNLDIAAVTDHLLLGLWAAVRQVLDPAPARGETSPDLVRRVREFETSVEDHLTAHAPVVWHASQIGVSPRSLMRACEAVLGVSPKKHLDRLVALEARRWLAHSDLSIEQVADALGFSDPSNFTKFFSRVARTTPREFRRGARPAAARARRAAR